MKLYDCIVIGGGPIGGYVANQIAERDYSVGVCEEHKEIGLPLRCAGLVTKRVLELSKIELNQNQVMPIFGAHVHSPNDAVFTIGGKKIHAYVIDRSRFDQELIYIAVRSGADLFLDTKIAGIRKKSNLVEATYFQEGVEKHVCAKMIVGADGPHSIVRGSFQFPSPLEYVRCVGAEISNISMDPRFVEIFIDSRLAPGFFAWIIPTSKDGTTARIGLGVSQRNSESINVCFRRLLKIPYLENIKIESFLGGSIPMGPLKKSSMMHVMLVGDAAAQVKPTSGGGLFPGLSCARICSDISLDALEKNKFDNRFFVRYHQKWIKEVGRELERGMMYRRIFLKMGNKEISKALKLLENDVVLDSVNTYGDIDFPSRLIRPLMKSVPSIVKALPGIFL